VNIHWTTPRRYTQEVIIQIERAAGNSYFAYILSDVRLHTKLLWDSLFIPVSILSGLNVLLHRKAY